MSVRGFVVTLLDPVAVPAQAATSARLQTLTHLPGGTFQGIAEAKLYETLSQSDAFTAFHSGAIRFGDAFPLRDSGHICLPVPISLHAPKPQGCEDASVKEATDAAIRDFAATPHKTNHKQLRDRYVTLDGAAGFHKPRCEVSMRTAIAFETGLADDGQLYGYEALSPGQRFLAQIEGDNASLLSRIADSLGGLHVIGRSKTAEFGRVRIYIENDTHWTLSLQKNLHAQSVSKGNRFIWFLSDAWFWDAHGLPTARPEPGTFEANKIDWSHSFVRTRRTAPYNAAWRARAEERVYVVRGSVLTLRNCGLAPGLHSFGMGRDRGNGLALVSAEPLCKVLKTPVDPLPERFGTGRINAEPTAFSEWLEVRFNRVQEKRNTADRAEDDLKRICTYYCAARRIGGEPVGPSAIQWAGLEARLSDNISVDSLLGSSEDRDSKLWGARFTSGEGEDGTFRGFVRDALASDEGRLRLRILAQKVRRAIDTGNWLAPDQQHSQEAGNDD